MVETLADNLSQELSLVRADPLQPILIITRSGGLQRWLKQRLATHLGTSGYGDGVTAGIDCRTLSHYETQLRGEESAWSWPLMTSDILTCLDELRDHKDFAQVNSYLSGASQRPLRHKSFAEATAQRFSRYVTWNFDTLQHWLSGEFVTDDGSPLADNHRWQAVLWNHLCMMRSSSPEQDRDLVCHTAQQVAVSYAHIALFCPSQITDFQAQLLRTMDEVHPLHVSSLTPAQSPRLELHHIITGFTGASLLVDDTLNSIEPHVNILDDPARSHTLLTGVQLAMSGGETTAELDDSLQIHTGYSDHVGEILSDLVVGLLNDDPTLEPKDILIVADRMEDNHGQLSALFSHDESLDAHPRHRVRGSLPAPPGGDPSSELIAHLFSLINSRATAEDLITLCSSALIMEHFGLTATDLERITNLVTASGIRWGVNAEHRRTHHMHDFPHNTWMAGLSRMVLGVGVSEDDMTWRGSVLPHDVVDSETIRLVETLGILITHVRDCVTTWCTPATYHQWAGRLRESLHTLTNPGPCLSLNIANTWESNTTDLMSCAEAESDFHRLVASSRKEPLFLNGNLAIAPLQAMSGVPFRVIIVYGLEAESFPRHLNMDGDDPLGVHPGHHPRNIDHQIFADLLRSARDKLIIVRNGFDTFTMHPRPTPSVERFLTLVVESLTNDHRSASHMEVDHCLPRTTHPTPSIDSVPRVSLAKVQSRTTPSAEPLLAEVTLTALSHHFANPGASWLRRYGGITGSSLEEPEGLPTTIPLSLSALDRWAVVNRSLTALLAGHDPSAILEAEMRRGTLPPGPEGITLGQQGVKQASRIFSQAQRYLSSQVSWRNITWEFPSGILIGSVTVHGDMVVDVQAGTVRPHHHIAAWITLLSLKVTHPDIPWTAMLIGPQTLRLTTPSVEQCEQHLTYLVELYVRTGHLPMPLPAEPSALFARYSSRGLAIPHTSLDDRLSRLWARDPSWSYLWATPQEMKAEPPLDGDTRGKPLFDSRFETLAHEVYSPLIEAGGGS
ncbi:MAG: exodeoxyribonuclease V subunit gamma [Propionibacteriaceae bacterium]|nr:exodeoxyribonuclease V subunit gamma [Propionibacteriaceae bacterium]